MAAKKARRTERRETTRADARLSMRVEGDVEGGDAPQLVTESQNISASGVYCYSDHYLAPLSKVALTIVLPKVPGARGAQQLIKCEGIVVRCDGPKKRGERHYELACAFSGLEPEWKQRIDEFVTWRNLQALRSATRASALNGRGRPAAWRRTAPAAKKKAVRRRTIH